MSRNISLATEFSKPISSTQLGENHGKSIRTNARQKNRECVLVQIVAAAAKPAMAINAVVVTAQESERQLLGSCQFTLCLNCNSIPSARPLLTDPRG